ncbi:MAG: hypothetical protein A4E65_02376 [Syntrophorhabdus sp. PtaU1.Bin153]|nr:MAG: hypothetical protein A4E65_02376 [Syntrophorhabdus sp. PtaU1.Bin153]
MERKNRLIQEYIHDPYFQKTKLSDPSVCEKCQVVFHNGIFDWLDAVPKDAEKMVCPACRRTEDNFEGGIVSLEGRFLAEHKQDIMNIIKNTENAEKGLRPLERIMKINDYADKIEVFTTYEHLARRIGVAINNACKGELELQYAEGKKHIRVYWKRD